MLSVLREIEARGSIETAKRIRQRISAVFTFDIGQGIVKDDPAEKLGAVLKPLREGRQPAITDLIPLRRSGGFKRLCVLAPVRPSEHKVPKLAILGGRNAKIASKNNPAGEIPTAGP
ncbi:phage integrase central domain-containing protein [Sphingobium yanoikuyae]|uniref:phage integrase central domain-containing protein n=1 Tax=Sphingobium yanoikuyae TaxID=13690 RepID=UPI0035ADA3AE